MPYPFLSAEWIAAAREIREKYEDDAPRIDIPIRMNQIVTKVPFGATWTHRRESSSWTSDTSTTPTSR
jgi:hypothetical protein